MKPRNQQDPVRDRLGRLRSMPVDTSGLERRFEALLDPSRAGGATAVRSWRIPARAAWSGLAAAAVLLAATVSVVLLATPDQAIASPAAMARLHGQIVSGELEMTPAGGMDEARRLIRTRWQDAPALPSLPADHVSACRLLSARGQPVAAILFEHERMPISLVVARSDALRVPDRGLTPRGGRDYLVRQQEAVAVVMTTSRGRLLCWMAETPADRLVGIAEETLRREAGEEASPDHPDHPDPPTASAPRRFLGAS